MTTILSPNRTRVDHRQIDLVVVHTMEARELPTTAEAVAAFFAKPSTRASAHVCIDNNSEVRCVPDHDVAWAAPGANHNGLQMELAGFARQTKADWHDPYSTDELQRAAHRAALWCHRHSIPVRYVDAAGLKAGKRGLTEHHQVTLAFHESTHTDPGDHFPWAEFLVLVKAELAGLARPEVSVDDIRAAWAHDLGKRTSAHPVQVKVVQKALGMTAPSGHYGKATRRKVHQRFPAATHGLLSRHRLEVLALQAGTFQVVDS